MFEKLSESASEILLDAYANSKQFKSDEISSAHILLSLTLDQDNLAATALSKMNVSAENMRAELEHQMLAGKNRNIAPDSLQLCNLELDELKFSSGAINVLKRAGELRMFFGHDRVEAEHLLLAILDTADEAAMKMFDELSANCTYMHRLIINLISEADSLMPDTPSLRRAVTDGISEMISVRSSYFEEIERLSTITGTRVGPLPHRSEIAHLIFIAYMPDFLFLQVAYQRYLLDMTLRLLRKRVGNLDPEFAASTVASSAQNLRQEVRATIEYIWSNEFRHMNKLPDEANYDLIGSVIEDLWWTHSEEIALNDVFDEAVDDHRRKQMLNLQKRRLEISERFKKLEKRLKDTIRQCFLKGSLSA